MRAFTLWACVALGGCGTDTFAVADSGPLNEAGGDSTNGVEGGPAEGGLSTYCPMHKDATFCCDWDALSKVNDTWDGLPVSGVTPVITTTDSVSAPAAMEAHFVNSDAGNISGYVFKDSLPSAGIAHLGLSFKTNGAPGPSIQLASITLHANGQDASFTVELNGSNDLRVTASASVTSAFCDMGVISAVPAWHRVDLAVDRNMQWLTCKVDLHATSKVPSLSLPAVISFGIQVGVLATGAGANGDVLFDNVLFDAVGVN